MSGGDGPCGLTRRRILRRRNPEPATSSTGHWRGVGCFVFAFGAITLGRRVRLLGPGEPEGCAAHDQGRLAAATGANLEVKCLDLTANPYLLLAGLLAAVPRMPEPVDVDPAALPPEELDRRGIRRLPTTLRQSTDALAADPVLRDALGPALLDSVLALRESDAVRARSGELRGDDRCRPAAHPEPPPHPDCPLPRSMTSAQHDRDQHGVPGADLEEVLRTVESRDLDLPDQLARLPHCAVDAGDEFNQQLPVLPRRASTTVASIEATSPDCW
jgi:Glutamine synthetase, catalytic domain